MEATGANGAAAGAEAATGRAVRLVLSPDEHRLLRLAAAERDVSMAAFAHAVLARALEEVRAGWGR